MTTLTLKHHGDRSIQWIPVAPAVDGLDFKKFEQELAEAEKISDQEGEEIWWYHYGIKVPSDIVRWSTNPWKWLTERNNALTS